MDEDLFRPWWERIPNRESDLSEEEEAIQRSEWYEELLKQQELRERRPTSADFRKPDGVYFLRWQRPSSEAAKVARKGKFISYVSP